MSNLMGTVVWFEGEDFEMGALELEKKFEALGYPGVVPNQEVQTALRRGIKQLLRDRKQPDRIQHELRDEASDTELIFNLVKGVDSYEIDLRVRIEKISGTISFWKPCSEARRAELGVYSAWERIGADDHEDIAPITELYHKNRSFRNGDVLRRILYSIMRHDCVGTPLKKGSGIHFVPTSQEEQLEKLRKVFAAFPESVRPFEMPVPNDEKSQAVIESYVYDDLFSDVEGLVKDLVDNVSGEVDPKDFREKSNTIRKIETRREKAGKLLDRAKLLETELRSKADGIKSRLAEIETTLGKAVNFADAASQPFDLGEALAELASGDRRN